MSWKWFISSIATLLTLIISIMNIIHQYVNLCKPQLQLYICRILTMIPIYAILSYISYMFVQYAALLNIIRDCYEAYVMFSFMQLLIFFIGGDDKIIKILESSKEVKPEIWPHYHLNSSLTTIGINEDKENIRKYNDDDNNNNNNNNNVMTTCKTCNIYTNYDEKELQVDDIYIYNLNNCSCIDYHFKISRFYSLIKLGVIQFVIIKPIAALLSLFLEYLGLYGAGSLSLRNGFLYISLLNSISVTISVYSLFLLYISLTEQLRPIKPVIKFFCIKLIIFVSFWQSIILSISSYTGIFPKEPLYTVKLHNWLLTIEMTLCAIIYGIAFSIKNDFKKHVNSNYLVKINSTDFNSNNDLNYHSNYIHNQSFRNEIINDPILPEYSKDFVNKDQSNSLIIKKSIIFILFKINYIFNPKDIIHDVKNVLKLLKYDNRHKYMNIKSDCFPANSC